MLPVAKLRQVEGELLTIIDASYPQGGQCEAVKSLVRQSLGKLYSYADYSEPTGPGGIAEPEKTMPKE